MYISKDVKEAGDAVHQILKQEAINSEELNTVCDALKRHLFAAWDALEDMTTLAVELSDRLLAQEADTELTIGAGRIAGTLEQFMPSEFFEDLQGDIDFDLVGQKHLLNAGEQE